MEDEEVRDISTNFLMREIGQAKNDSPSPSPNPVEYFGIFFSTEVKAKIVQETNKYAERFLNENKEYMEQYPSSRYHSWVPITVAKLDAFIGLSINMGIVKKANTSDYWCTKPSQSTPFFSSVMSKTRFLLTNRFIHLNDNRTNFPKDDD